MERTPAVAAAMERAGEFYDGTERRQGERRTALVQQATDERAYDMLLAAAQGVVNDALDEAEDQVHICDRNDDDRKAAAMPAPLAALYYAVKAVQARASLSSPAPAQQTERQEAEADHSQDTDIARELLRVARGHADATMRDLLHRAAAEANRFYGGMMNWKANAQAKDRTIIEQAARLAAPSPTGAQQWISVDEREPEEGQTVAVLYWPYDNRENSQVAGAAEYVDGAFYTHEGDPHHWPSHWAPIPAIPRTPAAAGTDAGVK